MENEKKEIHEIEAPKQEDGEMKQRNLLQRGGDKLAEFGVKHPKICRGIKLFVGGTLLTLVGGYGYKKGKESASRTETYNFNIDVNRPSEETMQQDSYTETPVFEEPSFKDNSFTVETEPQTTEEV